MPHTPEKETPEMPPPPTDWERSEQEKLPPRGSGSQDNQGEDKGKPRPHDVPQDEPQPVV
jgi:hypothetical protein